MLYSIFIYASDSGLLMWERNYDSSSNQQLEMLGSFFAAIKGFVKEIVLKGKKSDSLNNIEMGTHIIHIVAIKKHSVDIVFIGDKGDESKLKKITPKLVEVLDGNAQLFVGWEGGDLGRFDPLTAPIENLLKKQKDLLNQTKSLADDQEKIIRDIFKKRGKLLPEEINALHQEHDRVKLLVESTTNLLIRHRRLGELCQIEQRLGDEQDFISNARQQGLILQEINDLHYKLNFWLQETKRHLANAIEKVTHTQKTIREGDYKDAFRTLTDFTTSLKRLADDQVVTRFQVMCRYLIETNFTPPEVLSKTISEIMNLENDVFNIIENASVPLSS
jgi:hypothetical protein